MPDPALPVPRAIAELLDRRATSPLPSARALNPRVPHALEAILGRCLDPDPDRRYWDARDLAADLRCFLARRPLEHAPNPSRWERVRNSVHRHRRLAAALAIAAVLGATLYNGRVRHEIAGLGLGIAEEAYRLQYPRLAARLCDLAQALDPRWHRIQFHRALQAFHAGDLGESLDRFDTAERCLVVAGVDPTTSPREWNELRWCRAEVHLAAATRRMRLALRLVGADETARDLYRLAEQHLHAALEDLEAIRPQGDPAGEQRSAVLQAKAWLGLGDVASARDDYAWSVASYRVALRLIRPILASHQVFHNYAAQVQELREAARERLQIDGARLAGARPPGASQPPGPGPHSTRPTAAGAQALDSVGQTAGMSMLTR